MSTVEIRSNGGTAIQDVRPVQSADTLWRIDPAASRVEFTIGKRLMFVKKLSVTGRFADVKGTIMLDEQEPVYSRADVTIGAASVDTRNARRDKHLRTADFFHVGQHPTITFTSRRIEALDEAAGRYRVTGDLTVRGTTREVVLDALYTPARSGVREPRIRLQGTALLNRRDFGLVWNKAIINVADALTVKLDVEATRA